MKCRKLGKLSEVIKIVEPKGNSSSSTNKFEGIHTFLGCEHQRVVREVKYGPKGRETSRTFQCMVYNVQASLERAIVKYEKAVEKATGNLPNFKPATTPFVDEVRENALQEQT